MKPDFICAFLIFLTSCAAETKKPQEATQPETGANLVTFTAEQIKVAGIVTGKPRQQTVQATVRANGVVEAPPENRVTVSFPFGGYVVKADLLPGMQVRKGQVLTVLQDASFVQLQQDYLLSRSKLLFLEKEFERQRTLNQNKTTSDKVFEQTASEYRSERILVQALKEKLLLLGVDPARLSEANISRTVNLRAPISGYVSVVNVNRGKYVSPIDVLFELVDPADLHLSLTIFEKDLPAFRPGQQVKAWLTSDTARPYTASVHYVGKTLDNTRSALVHCDFTGGIPKLVPGMFLNADVYLEGQLATVVPEEAVVRFGNGEHLFIARGNNSFEMVPVQTGVRNNGWVALTAQRPDLLQQFIIVRNAYTALMKLHNRSEEE